MSVKITPRMPKVTKSEDYDEMKNGDFFISGNRLYIKCNNGNQEAICVQDGNLEDNLCNFDTIPVDVEIKWMKAEIKTKK